MRNSTCTLSSLSLYLFPSLPSLLHLCPPSLPLSLSLPLPPSTPLPPSLPSPPSSRAPTLPLALARLLPSIPPFLSTSLAPSHSLPHRLPPSPCPSVSLSISPPSFSPSLFFPQSTNSNVFLPHWQRLPPIPTSPFPMSFFLASGGLNARFRFAEGGRRGGGWCPPPFQSLGGFALGETKHLPVTKTAHAHFTRRATSQVGSVPPLSRAGPSLRVRLRTTGPPLRPFLRCSVCKLLPQRLEGKAHWHPSLQNARRGWEVTGRQSLPARPGDTIPCSKKSPPGQMIPAQPVVTQSNESKGIRRLLDQWSNV